jgi:hypothetical protein
VVTQGLVVLFAFVLGGDFWSPLLVDFLVHFRDLALGDLVGDVCVNPSVGTFSRPTSTRRSSLLLLCAGRSDRLEGAVRPGSPDSPARRPTNPRPRETPSGQAHLGLS